MASPVLHSQATGIHPGAYVQDTAPDTTDVQDHVLWVDTSNAPRLQLSVWNATTATWQPVAAASGATIFESSALDRPYPGQPGWLWFDIGNPVWSEDEQGYNFVLKYWDDDAYEWVSAVTPHRNVYLQDSPPPHFNSDLTLSLLGRGDLWIDSSTGPPYALNIWNDRGTPAWQAVTPWPYATLTTPPSTLVGQDPATGLPAFCPPPVQPVVPVTVPITPVVPDTGSTNTTAQCGAAVAMATYLEQYYSNVSGIIGSLESGFASWLLSAVMDIIIEAVTDGAATGWLILNQALIKQLASWLIVNALGGGNDFPALTTAQNDGILQSCFCALGPVSGSIALTDAIISDWDSRLDAMNLGFTVPEKYCILALMGIVSTQSWQRIAYQGSATPSSVCGGFSCP